MNSMITSTLRLELPGRELMTAKLMVILGGGRSGAWAVGVAVALGVGAWCGNGSGPLGAEVVVVFGVLEGETYSGWLGRKARGTGMGARARGVVGREGGLGSGLS